MKNTFKRIVAALFASAAVCMPLSSTPLIPDTSIIPITAEAATTIESGQINYEFFAEGYNRQYTLYFNIKNNEEKTAIVTGCRTYEGSINIMVPEVVNFRGVDYTITEIGDSAFEKQTNIRWVSLTKKCTKIGTKAFKDCSNMLYIYSESLSITDIGSAAFMNCSGLDPYWAFPVENVRTIGRNACKNCYGLKNLYMRKLESMGPGAFENCYSLEDVDLSRTKITEIPDNAFKNCAVSSETECIVDLPYTVRKIGKNAFYNCNGLRKIDIRFVQSIGDSAFEDCHSLEKVNAGGLYSIGKRAFYGCDPMTYFVAYMENVYIGEESLGYAHQRNFTGVKTNFTVYGANSGNCNAKVYAKENGLKYDKVQNAPIY